MKMNSNQSSKKPVTRGKHCINLYVDFDNETAGVFLTGHYQAQKTMLVATAEENPQFARVLIDAALDFVELLEKEERYLQTTPVQ